MINFLEKDFAGNTGSGLQPRGRCADLSFSVVQEGSCQTGIITVAFLTYRMRKSNRAKDVDVAEKCETR